MYAIVNTATTTAKTTTNSVRAVIVGKEVFCTVVGRGVFVRFEVAVCDGEGE